MPISCSRYDGKFWQDLKEVSLGCSYVTHELKILNLTQGCSEVLLKGLLNSFAEMYGTLPHKCQDMDNLISTNPDEAAYIFLCLKMLHCLHAFNYSIMAVEI